MECGADDLSFDMIGILVWIVACCFVALYFSCFSCCFPCLFALVQWLFDPGLASVLLLVPMARLVHWIY
jgi:hypothetical protein